MNHVTCFRLANVRRDALHALPGCRPSLHCNSTLALLQVLNDISPSLASTVKFHEPEFVKVEGHSVEWHNHLVGLGGTGLSVNPCLVRLGAVGASTLHMRAHSHACAGRLMAAAVSDTQHRHAGAVAAPTAINIAPAAIAVGATGVDADPSVISIGCVPAPRCCLHLRCEWCMLCAFAAEGYQLIMQKVVGETHRLQKRHCLPGMRSHTDRPSRSPKLIFVGPTGGPGMPSHLAFTPVLINVSPTWEIAPPGAGVPPIPQAGGVKVDPTPGHMVVTPPVDPGAGARDRAAVAEAAAVRAAGAP